MARRMSSSQFRSKMRQLEQKQRQHINEFNRAVNNYNQAVRRHNANVRSTRQRLQTALQKLQRQPTTTTTITTTRYVAFRSSVTRLHQAYERLEPRLDYDHSDPEYDLVLGFTEREAANSLEVMNALLDDASIHYEEKTEELKVTPVTDELRSISPDLDDRWRGAIFSLDPQNPDAARHFCTSAREVFTQILETKAPDADVLSLLPSCEKTNQGKPTRRAKIQYFLAGKGMADDELEEFVEQDMENIIQLFRVFNDGTHGSAGRFDFNQLAAIKKRVEDGILFLSQLVN